MDKEGAKVLMKSLSDNNPRVRSSAALGLGQMGEKSVSIQLLKMLKEDQDDKVKESCAWALGEIGDLSVISDMNTMKIRALGRGDRALAETIEKAINNIETPKTK